MTDYNAPHHHPSEATLLAHAAGSLAAAHRQVVAIHLALCPACAADLRLLERAGGALLDGLKAAPLDDGALDRMLARLDEPPPPRPSAPPPASPDAMLAALATKRWRWSGPGIALMPLMARDDSDTRLDLIRVAPGTGLLEHGHRGFESTIVLQGAFDDGVARYRVGDFGEAEGGLDHRPEALPGPDCICLIATSARLQPHSLLGRVVGPLLGL
jgi:putative transcriptional regulator